MSKAKQSINKKFYKCLLKNISVTCKIASTYPQASREGIPGNSRWKLKVTS